MKFAEDMTVTTASKILAGKLQQITQVGSHTME